MTSSSSIPLFEQSCQEITERLHADTSAEGRRLRGRALVLLDTFRSWSTIVPSPTERRTAIYTALSLYREAMDYLTSKH